MDRSAGKLCTCIEQTSVVRHAGEERMERRLGLKARSQNAIFLMLRV